MGNMFDMSFLSLEKQGTPVFIATGPKFKANELNTTIKFVSAEEYKLQ